MTFPQFPESKGKQFSKFGDNLNYHRYRHTFRFYCSSAKLQSAHLHIFSFAHCLVLLLLAMNKEDTSLNKYISAAGFCSRREADRLIEQARVTINGELAWIGAKVSAGQRVEIDGEPLKKTQKKPIYIACNKPVGVTSTTDPQDKTNIISFLGHPKRIFPIGRLDKDSDGLIFLTNDGDIVNKILRASNNHEKEYIVSVDKAVTPEFIKQMASGIPMLDTVTKKCFVRQEGSRRFRIVLTQGLNRQIRRMCEYLGYKVVSLTRTRIMNVELGNLPHGKWRYLTLPEVDKLNEMVALSSKTETYDPKGQPRQKQKQITPKIQDQEEEEEQEEEFNENDWEIRRPDRRGPKSDRKGPGRSNPKPERKGTDRSNPGKERKSGKRSNPGTERKSGKRGTEKTERTSPDRTAQKTDRKSSDRALKSERKGPERSGQKSDRRKPEPASKKQDGRNSASAPQKTERKKPAPAPKKQDGRSPEQPAKKGHAPWDKRAKKK
jgi:23S rRNA pseudouridine2604 synthase